MATGSISTLGIGSGLELQDILDQLREVDKAATVTPLETKVTGLEAQLEEFTVVKNKLLDMKSKALTLSLSSTFLVRSVTSSSESVLTATVADGTAAQNASVSVSRRATQSAFLSAGVSATTTSVNTQGSNQAFVFKLGTGSNVTITVPNGTTLAGFATLINTSASNPGVKATVINDGSASNPYKLVLQANDTGRDNEISISSQLPDLALAVQGQSGANLNAELTVNGITYQRQENTIDDILSGVTLNLEGTGSSTVTVASDDQQVIDLVTEFVTAYNDVVQEVRSKAAYDEETESFGILAGTTMRDLPYTLRTLVSTANAADSGGNIRSMFDLGLEFAQDGTITIDSEVLAAAVADHREGVEAFFVGDEDEEITGFAELANDNLRDLTGGTGVVEAEKSAAQIRIDDLELQIESATERLDKKYAILTKQFVELDRYMNQMNSISSFLTSQFDSLSKQLSSGG